MKIKVLVDNNTYIDQYYYGEPAVCYYIEDEDIRLLFDVGYSDIFMKNALIMNVKLKEISTIVISHGHDDHTKGLKYFNLTREEGEYPLTEETVKPITIIAHPNALQKKHLNGINIGVPFDVNDLRKRYNLKLSKEPIQVSKNLTFLGEIPQYNNYEIRQSIGKFVVDTHEEDDYVFDDSALVYQSQDGIYIITGCAHSGICNIIEHAKKVCNEERVLGILGGFHLFKVNSRLDMTIEYLKKNNVTNLYPCHCVAFPVKVKIHQAIPIHEVGVGLELVW